MNLSLKLGLNWIIMLLGLSIVSYAQSLSPEAKKIAYAFKELDRQPQAKEVQLSYIKAFPVNNKLFIRIFDPADYKQLYIDSHKYIGAFVGLAKNFPYEVIGKSIDIGKETVWDADATGDLQHAIVQLGAEHVDVFVKKIRTLPKYSSDHLITFLADVENHKAYPEYQRLIDALNRRGEKALADKFIRAREEREKIKE